MSQHTEATRIRDFSDRELLHIVADIAHANGDVGGIVSAEEAASRIFGLKLPKKNEEPSEDLLYAVKCVSARFSYMARALGVLEKVEKKQWLLTHIGNGLRKAELPSGVARTIHNMAERNMLELAHQTGERMFRASDPTAIAMRREMVWQHERRRRI